MSAFIRTNRNISPEDPALIPQYVLDEQEAETAWMHADYESYNEPRSPVPPAETRTGDYTQKELQKLIESFLRGYTGGTEDAPCGTDSPLRELPGILYEETEELPAEDRAAAMRHLIGMMVSGKRGYPRATAWKDLQRYAGMRPEAAEYELSWLQGENY